MPSADPTLEMNHYPPEQAIARNVPWTLNDLDKLIIVCCHAIWLGASTKGQDEFECILSSGSCTFSDVVQKRGRKDIVLVGELTKCSVLHKLTYTRLIEDFQKGETPTFIEHINCAVGILESQPDAMVVFSGGATKLSRSSLTEGQSYLNLALALHPHLALPPHQHILHAEPYATESYQNILFSLILFGRLTHHYPSRITIITHDFKRARFLELHVPAIRWPKDRVEFIGIDPPEAVTPRKWVEEEEREKGWAVWRRDLYGRGELVRRKRRERGWKDEVEGLVGEGCEEGVKGLLGWGGGRTGVEIFSGALPWDEDGVELERMKHGNEDKNESD